MKSIILSLIILLAFPTIALAGQWQEDTQGWSYENDDGSYATGWHQDVDGSWYYFDEETGYMLSDTVTPDGFLLSESGKWVEDDQENLISYEGYDNKIELEISAYDSLPEPESLGYNLPITVYYNENYMDSDGMKLSISNIEVSKGGLAYIVCAPNSIDGNYSFVEESRYYFSDGTYRDIVDEIRIKSNGDGELVSGALLHRLFMVRRSQPVSVTIYIKNR